MLMKIFIALSFTICCFAEIEEVIVTWNPIPCRDNCVHELEKRFLKIPAVEKVEINQANGFAKMAWKPNAPFSFVPINFALRWVGVREKTLRVRVKGKPILNKDTYLLISDKDKTAFTLLGPVSSNRSEYVVQFNRVNRPLPLDLQEQLKEAKKQNKTLIISGTIFMPERSPPEPLSLIVDHIQVEEKKS